MTAYDDEYRRQVRRWSEVVEEVERSYDATIDDYTNDLCLRDHIEGWVQGADPEERDRRRAEVEALDQRFTLATVEDVNGELAHYFRIDRRAGWWWKRIPAQGDLADYLREMAAEREPTAPGRIRRMLGGS